MDDGLQTARLRLRPSDAGSGAEVQAWLADPRVGGPFYGGRANPPLRSEEAQVWAAGARAWGERALLTLVAHERDGGALVGALCLNAGCVSYLVCPARWQQGFGTEMLDAACRHALGPLGLAALQARVLRSNLASRRLLERCGFRFAGLALREPGGGAARSVALQYRCTADGGPHGARGR